MDHGLRAARLPSLKRLGDRLFERAPAEFLLAAACCRWPRSEERAMAIRQAAAKPIDWQHFLRVVTRHRVWGLVHDGFRQAEISPPPEIADALGAQAALVSRHNLASAAESLRLQRLFNEAGIRVVFVKGVSLAMLAYGDLALKHGRDIDLLVSPADIEAAMAVLERAGYALQEPGPALNRAQRELLIRHCQEFGFRHQETGSEVELHWRLSCYPFLLRRIDVFSFPQPVRLAETSHVHTLQQDDLLAYLCVHGAVHAWFRLKWLGDFAALLRTHGDGDIERFYCLAQAAGAARCVGQALLLCERLVGVRLPSSLANELRRCTTVVLLEAWALNVMLRGNAALEPGEKIESPRFALFRLLLGDKRCYLHHQLRRDFFSAHDIAGLPLPAPLHFLYPLMRIPSWWWRRAKYHRRARRLTAPVRQAETATRH